MDDITFEIIKGKCRVMPNVIYNRFDLVYHSEKYIHIICNEQEWDIPFWIENKTAYLGLYLVEITQIVFEKLIDFVFHQKHINKILIKKSRNNYRGQLSKGNHYRIELPDTVEALLGRMSKKGRYNYNREKRLLQALGNIEYMHYETEELTDDIINIFFKHKYKTHGREYHMKPKEYIEKYMVSDAYSINIDGKIIGILLSCEQCECIYFDNFSYDIEYSKYSVGFQVYVYFLQEMAKNKRKQVFLLGGEYEYKKRFGSIEETAYDGYLYKTKFVKMKSRIVNKIEQIKYRCICGMNRSVK